MPSKLIYNDSQTLLASLALAGGPVLHLSESDVQLQVLRKMADLAGAEAQPEVIQAAS